MGRKQKGGRRGRGKRQKGGRTRQKGGFVPGLSNLIGSSGAKVKTRLLNAAMKRVTNQIDKRVKNKTAREFLHNQLTAAKPFIAKKITGQKGGRSLLRRRRNLYQSSRGINPFLKSGANWF